MKPIPRWLASFLTLLFALGPTASPAQAQSTARLSLGTFEDAAVGNELRLAVEGRRLQSARTVEVLVVADAAAVRWNEVVVGEGARGMIVLDQRQTGDTLSVVLSHLSRGAGTTLLRTTPILHLRGTRLAATPITFSLAARPVAVVSRTGTVQPVELGDAIVTAVEAGGTDHSALLGVRPNPARDAATLWFEAATPALASVAVYDLTGRTVLRLGARPVTAGRHTFPLVLDGLAPGVYLYRLTLTSGLRDHVFTGRMTLLR